MYRKKMFALSVSYGEKTQRHRMLVKSPISQPGAKYFLRKKIFDLLPAHSSYIDVFGGTGTVLLGKSKSKIEVFNEINSNIAAFFSVVKDTVKCRKLVDILDFMPYSRQLWKELKVKWKLGDIPKDEIQMVAEWFYISRLSFSADRNGGFATASVSTLRNPCVSFRNIVNDLEQVSQRLRNVIVECLDFRQVIQKYDSPGSLFMVDAPYLLEGANKSKRYYGHNFGVNDHRELCDMLNDICGMAVITHYEHPLYEKLYKDWSKYEFQNFKVSYGLTKQNPNDKERPKVRENVYTNFEQKQRSLFNV